MEPVPASLADLADGIEWPDPDKDGNTLLPADTLSRVNLLLNGLTLYRVATHALQGRVMPRCAFGDGRYRCTKRGIGMPPLCREHYELVAGAEEEVDETGADFFDDLFDRLLDHPYVREKIDEVVQVLRDPAARHPNYQGPGMAYAAECPPRPKAQPRAGQRPSKPPDPPKPNGLSVAQAREILHFSAKQTLTATEVRKRQRQLARLAHPDVGGSVEAMARINAAASFLISQLG